MAKIAQAIDYSLNAWKALTLHLDDGAVAIDNNLISGRQSRGSWVPRTGCSWAASWLASARRWS
jgi:hypothetical protein